MGSYFFTKVSKCSSLRRSGTGLFVAHVRILTAEAQSLTKHQQGRAYAQFPGQLSKTRGPNTPSSPLRPFSSSTPPSSYSKAGFVGWYLSMLESRPLFTKSVSSCLIYAAADLTSQVKNLTLEVLYELTFSSSGAFEIYASLVIFMDTDSLRIRFSSMESVTNITACTLTNCKLAAVLGIVDLT